MDNHLGPLLSCPSPCLWPPSWHCRSRTRHVGVGAGGPVPPTHTQRCPGHCLEGTSQAQPRGHSPPFPLQWPFYPGEVGWWRRAPLGTSGAGLEEVGKTLQLPHMLMAKSELCPLHSQGLDPRRITGFKGGGCLSYPSGCAHQVPFAVGTEGVSRLKTMWALTLSGDGIGSGSCLGSGLSMQRDPGQPAWRKAAKRLRGASVGLDWQEQTVARGVQGSSPWFHGGSWNCLPAKGTWGDHGGPRAVFLLQPRTQPGAER